MRMCYTTGNDKCEVIRKMNTEARVFNIQRFSTHDGPGIRTTVFFKGCNLHCKWCHNPESISAKPQIELCLDLCIGCGECFKVCKNHMIAEGSQHVVDRKACTACGRCADTCYAGGIKLVGEELSVEKLMEEILTDKPYYDASGGGVTFSGGECMIQPEALARLTSACREAGVHTAVDTAGNVAWSVFEAVDADMYLYDVKAADPELHKRLTGVDNRLILENLKRLSDSGKRIWVRIPYIPGCNDVEIPEIARILKDIKAEKVELLAYHRLGEGKYDSLGLEKGEAIRTPNECELNSAVETFKSFGINAVRS